jgi:hypothetical protein
MSRPVDPTHLQILIENTFDIREAGGLQVSHTKACILSYPGDCFSIAWLCDSLSI